MNKTNYEHLQELDQRSMANAILNINADLCLLCRKEMVRKCNDQCGRGLSDWMSQKYISTSSVWKERATP